MSEITVGGKLFKAKKITLFVLLKTLKLEEKLNAASEKEDWTEYAKLWMDKVELYLEGETITLNPDNITPADYKRLNDFFTSCLAEVMPKSDATNETLQDSTASASSPTSPQGTI